jgi:hypothetical protein
MAVTLAVSVSDELLEHLRRLAAQENKTPEDYAAECLKRMLPLHAGDFLKRWAGAFASNVPDAGLHHHEYLGQALYEELQEKKRDD